MTTCETCQHARKAGNDSVVMCGKTWRDFKDNSGLWPKHIPYSGWGYPGRRPNTESSGTVGEGVMVNNMPLIEKEKEEACYEPIS